MIKTSFKDYTNYGKLKNDINRSAISALYRLASFMTTSAKSLIRKRKKPSNPGKPYSRGTGFMKNSIITVKDDRSIITKYYRGQKVGAVMEFGGINPLNKNMYPDRPVFEPALKKAIRDFDKKFPEDFQKYFGKTLN